MQDIPDNRLKLAQHIQKMSQALWKSWAQDYLHQLQQRTKWRQEQPNLKVGDLVIIKEDNIPPTLWKAARVTKTFEGSDGLVRNMQLRVATSDWKKKPSEKKVPFTILERPVQKLCRLLIEDVEAETSRAQCVHADNNLRTQTDSSAHNEKGEHERTRKRRARSGDGSTEDTHTERQRTGDGGETLTREKIARES